ncbi:hypothetical protein P8452_03795 [Trifolium repens]|nr:hypothetical protein P8452_03795 [Trifolium repens]
MAISSSQFHVAPVSSPMLTRSHLSFKWEIVVNTSIARARNVLTFPREYSRNCLSSSDNVIYMIDVATGSTFKSPIFTSTKNREDRYAPTSAKPSCTVYRSKAGIWMIEKQNVHTSRPSSSSQAIGSYEDETALHRDHGNINRFQSSEVIEYLDIGDMDCVWPILRKGYCKYVYY